MEPVDVDSPLPVAPLFASNPILLAKVVKDLQLALLHQFAEGDQHDPEWIHAPSGVLAHRRPRMRSVLLFINPLLTSNRDRSLMTPQCRLKSLNCRAVVHSKAMGRLQSPAAWFERLIWNLTSHADFARKNLAVTNNQQLN